MAESKPTATAAAAPTTDTKNAPAGSDKASDNITDEDDDYEGPNSGLSDIECTVIKPFYSKEGAMLNEGAPYVFNYDEQNKVFPWPILLPTDKSLHKPLKAEYEDFKKNKMQTTGRAVERQRLLARLAEVDIRD
jgi:hypothetical protein